MDRRKRTLRLYVLMGFVILVLLGYLAVLFDTQVNQHDYYLAQSIRTITREESITASRGIITDRNGQTLVANRSSYDLTFDSSLLKSGENVSDAILRLVKLCQDQGVVWNDNLPISSDVPFALTLDLSSDLQKDRFLSYLKSLKPACQALESYCARNPDLLDPVAEGAAADASVLDRLPTARFTARLLSDAGISADQLVLWMREALAIPVEYSRTDARLVLGIQYELSIRDLIHTTAYVLADDVDTDLISRINDGAYSGARIVSSSTREYETTYGAHILGSVGRIQNYSDELKEKGYALDDWIGRDGAESAFENYLRGTDGRRIVFTSSEGKITDEFYAEEPQPGNTVALTLDLTLQQAAEQALAETVERMNATDGLDTRGAGAAVIQVGTGEILALASYPTYNLATYREDYGLLLSNEAKPLLNRATSGTYAPGSTLKPLTAVASLEEGVVTLTEKIRDTGKWIYPGYPDSYTYCWNRAGHGPLNVSQAITNSCNYFFAEMGYRMGMDTLNQYLSAFGLGSHTGIEIGDKTGTLPSQASGEDLAPWAAYGQANQLYTPLQLSNYIATLVSGGKHCQAHLLKSVKSYDNTEIVAVGSTEPLNTVQISDSTLRAVKEGMHNLTTGSLSAYFSKCVVDAGAKTGTAQISADIENNGVFVCFAPYDDPEIAVAIVIEKGGSGAALASAAVQIINAYFTEEEIAAVILPENQLLP